VAVVGGQKETEGVGASDATVMTRVQVRGGVNQFLIVADYAANLRLYTDGFRRNPQLFGLSNRFQLCQRYLSEITSA
jgi:hypothetical protein